MWMKLPELKYPSARSVSLLQKTRYQIFNNGLQKKLYQKFFSKTGLALK